MTPCKVSGVCFIPTSMSEAFVVLQWNNVSVCVRKCVRSAQVNVLLRILVLTEDTDREATGTEKAASSSVSFAFPSRSTTMSSIGSSAPSDSPRTPSRKRLRLEVAQAVQEAPNTKQVPSQAQRKMARCVSWLTICPSLTLDHTQRKRCTRGGAAIGGIFLLDRCCTCVTEFRR